MPRPPQAFPLLWSLLVEHGCHLLAIATAIPLGTANGRMNGPVGTTGNLVNQESLGFSSSCTKDSHSLFQLELWKMVKGEQSGVPLGLDLGSAICRCNIEPSLSSMGPVFLRGVGACFATQGSGEECSAGHETSALTYPCCKCVGATWHGEVLKADQVVLVMGQPHLELCGVLIPGCRKLGVPLASPDQDPIHALCRAPCWPPCVSLMLTLCHHPGSS